MLSKKRGSSAKKGSGRGGRGARRVAKKCRFCRSKKTVVDYKDVNTLRKLTTLHGKIFSRKRSGNCAKHQRQLQAAVKRARFLALL